MALENLQTGANVPANKAIIVGNRGGMKYDSALGGKKQMIGDVVEGFYPPTYIIQGPGVDMAFFRVDGGFDIKYKGPYCEEAVELAKAMATAGSKFKEIIDELCKEFNCHILSDEDN